MSDQNAEPELSRRKFLGAVGALGAGLAATPALLGQLAAAAGPAQVQFDGVRPARPTAPGEAQNTMGPRGEAGGFGELMRRPAGRLALETFDYSGVKLGPSRLRSQYEAGRDYYLGLSDDDILHGYRQAANLSAPGAPLGGWARTNSDVVFGQWVQALARGYRATGHAPMRDKAVHLVSEYAKTVGPDGNCRMAHYGYEKLMGGLVDMDRYGDYPEARRLLSRVADWGMNSLDRENLRAEPTDLMASGFPHEWYTVAENCYRAYQLTGEAKYKEFGDAWLYHDFWDKFADNPDPLDAYGFHGYSHVNTFSSAAMAYAVSGDEKFLHIIKNAHEWLQNRQCYATGGYGPYERIMASDGALGRVLERGTDTFENPCGTWAGFKLAKYLMQFTGDAKYGDWMERLLYNGIGAALPITSPGKTFYYASYHLGSAKKVYYEATYPCCSGTYFQDIVEFHNLIYMKDREALYVNLYVPSELTWKRGDDAIKVVQETSYPEDGASTITIDPPRAMRFAVKLRVPGWARGMSFKVNGATHTAAAKPGEWATFDREWKPGDKLDVHIPLMPRRVPVDRQHPNRVAIARGPLVLAQEVTSGAIPIVPADDAKLEAWLRPAGSPAELTATHAAGGDAGHFRPLYAYAEGKPYRVYFDHTFVQPKYDKS